MKKTLSLWRLAAALFLVLSFVFSSVGCYVSIPGIAPPVIPEGSVADLLSKSETVPEFDKNRFYLVESCFIDYYYTELEDSASLAEKTVLAFDEFCREIFEGKGIDEITYALIDCYIYSIGDPYAFYRTEEAADEYNGDLSGSFVGIGVSIIRNDLKNTIYVESAEPGSPAEGAGITSGDYIVAVDGVRVTEIGTIEATDRIKGEIGTNVTITILRGEEEFDLTMTRAKITETTVSYEILEDGRIGYVKITGFKSNTAAQFIEAIDAIEDAGCESVIFDLRKNPGGYLRSATAMLSYLVPDGTKIVSFSSDRAPIYATSGPANFFEKEDHVITMPSVLICNGSSASAAELFSAAIRDYNKMDILDATLIGNVTYKKGVMQNSIPFSDGSLLTLTTALYYPPLGENFNGIGVIPDVILEEGEDHIAIAIGILSNND